MPAVDSKRQRAGIYRRVLNQWAYERGVKLHFIRARKANPERFIESFNSRFGKSCSMSTSLFTRRRARKSRDGEPHTP